MDQTLPFTPVVVVDRTRLAGNIRGMQALADRHGLRLRPHIKTHKSPAIARLQLAAGAVGVTAAKPGEARIFVEAGVSSVTLAYPVLEARRLDPLLEAARACGAELRLLADCRPGVAALAEAALRHGRRLPVFLKVDVGLHRIGVAPDGPEAPEIARAIADHPKLAFQGLLAHAGHAYGATGRAAVAAVAEAERRTLVDLAGRLAGIGVPVSEISVGATPTALAQQDFTGLTEIRPGNYVFLDGTALRQELAGLDQVALTVEASVVGRTAEHAIIDAGSKVLSSDLGPHGSGGAFYGRVVAVDGRDGELPAEGLPVVRLSEEHGFVRCDGFDLQRGSRVTIVPNHACAVANLASELWLTGAGQPPEPVEVAARAQVR